MSSSDLLARQKKRDSMLFGDVDEPPLITAAGDPYQPVRYTVLLLLLVVVAVVVVVVVVVATGE